LSVIVEALTLIVPRLSLDVSFPGGTDGFVEFLGKSDFEFRFALTDDHIAAVSAFNPEALTPIAHRLIECGLVEADDDAFVEFAFVDQRFGPTLNCPWLKWRIHDEGYTSAWLATAEPGGLYAPTDWTPEQSRGLTRTDIRDEPGWGMQLADENGVETWIEFNTGRQRSSLTHREQPTPSSGDSTSARSPANPELDQTIKELAARMEREKEARLMTIVRQALDEAGWNYNMLERNRAMTFHVAGAHVRQDFLLVVDEASQFVVCYLSTTLRVPDGARQAVAEFLSRINYGVPIGNFEMDFDDGDVRYRTSVDLDGGTLTPRMVMLLIANAGTAFDSWYPALMKVIFAGISPEIAFREHEEGE
jgi:hypothetical protein